MIVGSHLAVHRAWRAGELTPNEFLACLLACALRHESEKVPRSGFTTVPG